MGAIETELSDLIDQIKSGHFSLSDIVLQCQGLESVGNHLAAANLYNLWIIHSDDRDKNLALFNYAIVLNRLGKIEEAIQVYTIGIQVEPTLGENYVNLGLLLERQGQIVEAIEIWSKLSQLFDEGHPIKVEIVTTALNHIGRTYENLRQYDAAEAVLKKSLGVNPHQPGVIQHHLHIRQKACKWPIFEPLPGVDLADMKRYMSPLAMLALTDDPAELLICAQSFVSRTYPFVEQRLYGQYQHSKIRVGYVSGDFREHAVGFLLPHFLNSHDRHQFELYGYDFSPEQDTQTRRLIKSSFDQFRSIHDLTDEEAAKLVRSDEIDVLIDLHGLSSGARPGIFAHRPAPKQGTYLGFIGTTALPWIDFVICDEALIPSELATYFTEKPLYVKGSFLPLAPSPATVCHVTRESLGIKSHQFAMGAMGNTYKITQQMFETWMQILNRIPDSVLILIDDNECTTNNLKKEASKVGVGEDQILFLKRTDHDQFLARLKCLDVFLDTFPYNCGSTTNDVIHAGVPMVTLQGRSMVSRMGLSILQELELNEYVTHDHQEYANKILEIYLKKKNGKNVIPSREIQSFQINEALLSVHKSIKINDESIRKSDDLKPTIRLFHIQDRKDASIERNEGIIPLFAGNQMHKIWGEWWIIRDYLIQNHINNRDFYGFVPSYGNASSMKSMIDLPDFIHRFGDKADVITVSTSHDPSAMFRNPIMHLETLKPGMLHLIQALVDYAQIKLDVKNFVLESESTIHDPCFIATGKFWIEWLELFEKLKLIVEEQHFYDPGFSSGDGNNHFEPIPSQSFIAGQLANLLLAQHRFKVKNINTFAVNRISDIDNNDYKRIIAKSLKLAYVRTCSPEYIKTFDQLSEFI
jgi:predicted O-linked N-acetylglucosamine transferase (SPINDLY family)